MSETPREIAERLAQNFNYAFRGSYVPSAYRDATTAIEVALNAERERAAKILETRADELQAEWSKPPCAENGFIAMTADSPAGYATYWGMSNLRKLANQIRGKD